MSNFQAAANAQGQSTTMLGRLTEIGAAKLSKNKKQYCSCKIADNTGTARSATIHAGRSGLPQSNLLGQMCVFSLSTYQGQNGLAFGGFCNGIAGQPTATPAGELTYENVAKVAPPAQNVPMQNVPIQNVPVQNVPLSKPRDYDKENRGKCRFGFYQAFIEAGGSPSNLLSSQVELEAIEKLVEYSMEGVPLLGVPEPDPAIVDNSNPDWVGSDPAPPPDDGIPF